MYELEGAFEQLFTGNPITLNLAAELYIPESIASKSIELEGDIAVTLRGLNGELRALLEFRIRLFNVTITDKNKKPPLKDEGNLNVFTTE